MIFSVPLVLDLMEQDIHVFCISSYGGSYLPSSMSPPHPPHRSSKERFHLPFHLGAPDNCEMLNTDETPSVASFSYLLSVINHVIHNNHNKPETIQLVF